MRLLAITDVERASEEEHLDAYARLNRLIPLWVELRDRRDARRVIAFGRRLMDLGVPLLVNDRVDVALLLGARGVHLGRASITVAEARTLLGERPWVSVSAHAADPGPAPRPADRADGAGRADAALLSPIFSSPGKAEPLGTGALTTFRARCPDLTLLALGGVDATNARSCLDAGADGVAVIRAALDVDQHAALAHALR